MNFLPVIIGVLLFSLFSDKGGGKQSGGSGNAIDMENIQNTVGAINSFNKLGGKDTDKMSVVMELMSNPVVAELVGKFLGNQPTEIQQRAARMLFNLRPEDWELIEQRARELLGE